MTKPCRPRSDRGRDDSATISKPEAKRDAEGGDRPLAAGLVLLGEEELVDRRGDLAEGARPHGADVDELARHVEVVADVERVHAAGRLRRAGGQHRVGADAPGRADPPALLVDDAAGGGRAPRPAPSGRAAATSGSAVASSAAGIACIAARRCAAHSAWVTGAFMSSRLTSDSRRSLGNQRLIEEVSG